MSTPLACAAIFACVTLFIGVILGGVQVSRLQTLVDAACPCTANASSSATAPEAGSSGSTVDCAHFANLHRVYCERSEFFGACFDTVAGVETFLLAREKDAIFKSLSAIEPQNGTVFYWAVDEASESEDSHLDLRTSETAEYFKNNAYYYSQERHRESVLCGGWSLTYWKTSEGKRSLQLVYCEESASDVRVCGAFDVFSYSS